MIKKRDYKAEYRRRIERGLTQGLTRSQARGHGKPKQVSYNPRLEEGLKVIRKGSSLSKAAKSIHAAPETLRRYIKQAGVAKKKNGRLFVGTDQRKRQMPIFSTGKEHTITVANYDAAFEAGRYMAAVKTFLATNDPSVLKPFKGQSIIDVSGKQYIFETRPNVLYRLQASQTESFEDVYRIVS